MLRGLSTNSGYLFHLYSSPGGKQDLLEARTPIVMKPASCKGRGFFVHLPPPSSDHCLLFHNTSKWSFAGQNAVMHEEGFQGQRSPEPELVKIR
jgi:hypothetical protein